MKQITMRHIAEASSNRMQNNAGFNSLGGDLYTYQRSEHKLT